MRQTEGDRIGVIEARAPFDLSAGPLIRATLLRFSPTVSIILVTTHQVVSDGWSIGVMAREMGIIYDGLRQGKPIELEDLSIQYADYSQWQLEWLKARGTEAETTYWTRQLAGVKPFKVLADHARPAMPTTQGAIASHLLPRELTNRAQTLSVERGATLFAVVFAALCATLARFTDETEIVIGTQVSDRDQVELEPMVGQFVNSLILRADVSGDPAFGTLVDRMRDTIAHALEHRHIPIERLLGMVKGERSHPNTPPISVNFIFQKTFIRNTTYTDFALIDMPSLPTGAIYDLNLFMVERPDGWRFSCQYNTDQFERATADRLLTYFQALLDSAVANPSQRLSALTLCPPPDEARTLFAALNDTRSPYPRDLTLAQLFEAQAARTPGAIAVACGDRQLSFEDMNASADRFSAYLRQQGNSARFERGHLSAAVGGTGDLSARHPQSRRSLRAARSQRSGAAPCGHAACGRRCRGRRTASAASCRRGAGASDRYVEAALAHRRPTATAVAAASALGSETSARLGSDASARLSSDASARPGSDAAARLSSDAPARPGSDALARPGSDASACIVVTAGSDGAIRAVGISHRSLTNLVCSIAKRPGIGEHDVILACSPVTAGQAAFEWFSPAPHRGAVGHRRRQGSRGRPRAASPLAAKRSHPLLRRPACLRGAPGD